MEELFREAKEELKRADHLIYVSLKYTRTVDVIKNIIERLINAFDITINALLKYSKNKKKIQEIPTTPKQKCELIREVYGEDRELMEFVDFYLLLRRINKMPYRGEKEFRRHVTMILESEGEELNINIDIIYEYFEKAKRFVEYVINKVG